MPRDNLPGSRLPPPAGDQIVDGFYPRYLAAKKGIDDRALNRHVWETLRRTCRRPRLEGRRTLSRSAPVSAPCSRGWWIGAC